MAKTNTHKLHPMGDFGVVPSLKAPLRVQRFADRLVPLIPFPHKHSFYHLLVITAGKGWHEIDFQRYPLEAGRIFLMKPAQVHSWSLDKSAQGFVIEFEEELIRSHPSLTPKIHHLFQVLPDSFKISDRTEYKNIQSLCESMLGEYQQRRPDYETLNSLTLFSFLILLSRTKGLRKLTPPPQESFLTRYENLVEAHYQKHHDVEFYAEKLNISAKALTMKTTRLRGKGARAFIQDRLMLETKRLLAYSDMSVAEIAANLGFEDANYFTRFFRIKNKTTPLAFRKKAKDVS